METIHLKIRTNTKRGKHLLELLREMAKTGRDIEFENIPNDETIETINDARAKKRMNFLQLKGKAMKKGVANLRGKLNLSDAQYNDFQKDVKNSREGWEKNI